MNKNFFLRSLFVLPMVAMFSSCVLWIDGTAGKGSIVEQNINVSGFNAIEASSSAEVTVVEGDSLQVTLSDYENLIEFWDIKVVNNTLIVQTKPFTSLINSKAKVSVVLPGTLTEVKVSGSGDIELNSAFPGLEKASISGSGSIKGNSETDYTSLDLNISGSGSLSFIGTSDELNAKTTGSGKMLLSDLVTKDVICTVSGSGNMYVNAVNSLKVVITGSGDIVYTGTPAVDIQTSGSGRVRHN